MADLLYRPLPDSFDERVPASEPRPPYNSLFWVISSFYLGVGVVLFFFTPKFMDVFDQIDVAMPVSTVWVGSLSTFVCEFPWAWIIGTLLLARYISRLPRSRNQEVCVQILVILGMISNLGLILLGMFLPFLSWSEGIN